MPTSESLMAMDAANWSAEPVTPESKLPMSMSTIYWESTEGSSQYAIRGTFAVPPVR